MLNLRKKRELEEISASSMSDIAFLLLIFFMVASVFYVKEGIMSQLPKKHSAPQQVKEENVYIFTVNGTTVSLKHPSIGEKTYKDLEEFKEKLDELDIPAINEGKFALLTTGQKKTTVQNMVEVLGIVKDRGFLKISLQRMKKGGS